MEPERIDWNLRLSRGGILLVLPGQFVENSTAGRIAPAPFGRQLFELFALLLHRGRGLCTGRWRLRSGRQRAPGYQRWIAQEHDDDRDVVQRTFLLGRLYQSTAHSADVFCSNETKTCQFTHYNSSIGKFH